MSTAVESRPATPQRGDGGQQVADVFVIFGIIGDLAKVMTFNSLYRLEHPPPVHPYPQGTWGPAEADKVLSGYGRWHEPRVAA
jgi:glucose-6-phosphate 1-dehydrogenase